MRFSLHAVLICVALIAVYFALLFAVPSGIGFCGLVVLSLLLLPAIVGGIVYARGTWQAFWIGCAVGATPLVTWFYQIASSLPGIWVPIEGEGLEWFGYTIASWHLLMIVNGMVVIVIRWLYQRRMGSSLATAQLPHSVLQRQVIMEKTT